MTIQELVDRASAREPDLRIEAWDRTDYAARTPSRRVTEATVSSGTKGQGSLEPIAILMRGDQVKAIAPGSTALWWQVAALQKTLDDDLGARATHEYVGVGGVGGDDR